VMIDLDDEFPAGEQILFSEELAVIQDYCPDVLLTEPSSTIPAAVLQKPPLDDWLPASLALLPQNIWIGIGTAGGKWLLLEGWSHQEDWGRWGLGKRHRIRLPPQPSIRGDLLLLVDARAPIFSQAPAMNVQILVNARVLGEWNFSSSEPAG